MDIGMFIQNRLLSKLALVGEIDDFFCRFLCRARKPYPKGRRRERTKICQKGRFKRPNGVSKEVYCLKNRFLFDHFFFPNDSPKLARVSKPWRELAIKSGSNSI